MTTDAPDYLYTRAEAALYLRTSVSAVDRARYAGQIRAVLLGAGGRAVRFTRRELDAYQASRLEPARSGAA